MVKEPLQQKTHISYFPLAVFEIGIVNLNIIILCVACVFFLKHYVDPDTTSAGKVPKSMTLRTYNRGKV